MTLPYEPVVFGIRLNVHLILEYLAFFIAFRYYIVLRKNQEDKISKSNRYSIILGAAIGAFFGSRIFGILENPLIDYSQVKLIEAFNTKTIMGGLFGGLVGVEAVKFKIGEKSSSGDLFTFPIIVGIFIGRIGCFLSGVNEFTYGEKTSSILGMNLGDGVNRHPLALYELIFLILLFLFLRKVRLKYELTSGQLFKYFMILYFSFRFFLEFLKPNVFFILGLSSIQILCIICCLYYSRTIRDLFQNAYKKLYILRFHS